MRGLCWIVVVMAVAGCKSKGSAGGAGSGSALVGSALGSAVSADAAPAADAAEAAPTDAAAAAAGPGCEGWRAKKVEEMGMGQRWISVECANGKVTLTSQLEGARDDEVDTQTKTLTPEAWAQLWQRLEAASWRTLDPACPTVTPPPESMSVTGLELAISDGKTTKQLTCAGANVTAVHQQIMDALEAAAE